MLVQMDELEEADRELADPMASVAQAVEEVMMLMMLY